MMDEAVPFPLRSRPWSELAEDERAGFPAEYLPLPASHAEQIRLLLGSDARKLSRWLWARLPHDWSSRPEPSFRHMATLPYGDFEYSDTGKALVRRWLFERGIPFRRTIYVHQGQSRIVQTTWRIFVRYWDAFPEGFTTTFFDHTLQWAGCFRHEGLLVFASQ